MVGRKWTGEVKNSIGNGEAKDFICMTHGHELRAGGRFLEGRGVLDGVGQREKNWDKCNCMIINIYLRNRKEQTQATAICE